MERITCILLCGILFCIYGKLSALGSNPYGMTLSFVVMIMIFIAKNLLKSPIVPSFSTQDYIIYTALGLANGLGIVFYEKLLQSNSQLVGQNISLVTGSMVIISLLLSLIVFENKSIILKTCSSVPIHHWIGAAIIVVGVWIISKEKL